MRILIELPTWLGDTVMATPAIEYLINFYNDSEIILIGSVVAIQALENHPKVTKTYVLDKNYINLYKTIKSFGKFEVFFSFRGSYRSKFIKFCISSKKKYHFDKFFFKNSHQVEKYNNFVKSVININSIPIELILHTTKKSKNEKSRLLGINPGATYGSAKRWYPKEFADVAIDLSNLYDIVIFGGPGEKDIAKDIEKYLIKKGVTNYQNLSSKTSINELISQIANLDLFITGDSGPMHIAAVYKIPTVAIFGPTNDKETSQWMNENGIIVKRDLECQPCMKRKCPLRHHNCMKSIKSVDILDAVNSVA
jgi:heptosyltransferase II